MTFQKHLEPATVDHSALAACLRRLMVASKLRREAEAEESRLIDLAWELGATDRTVAHWSGLDYGGVRKRHWRWRHRDDKAKTEGSRDVGVDAG